MRPGWYGAGVEEDSSTKLKIAVLAPMPYRQELQGDGGSWLGCGGLAGSSGGLGKSGDMVGCSFRMNTRLGAEQVQQR